MKIESVWAHGEEIPQRYSVEGLNISPPIVISDVPEDARSLVLIMYDPDIPQSVKDRFGIKEWIHWILFNIPPSTREIPESQNVGTAGINTRGVASYGGPNPPDGTHRYAFRLYALNKVLGLGRGATKEGIDKAMNGSVIAQTEMMGTYKNKKGL